MKTLFLKLLKIVLLSLCLYFLFTGCGASTSAQKVDEELLNHFSSAERAFLRETNPDLVTMQYLIDHPEDYATELSSDRNDFFVIVHGIVSDIEIEEYDDEILDIMSPEVADLLRGKTGLDIYFDGCSTPLNDPDSDFSVEVGKEYYFYVYVKKSSTGYSYTPFRCFDFN